MTDRLVHVTYDVLRNVVESSGKSLSSRDEANPQAAQ